MATVATTAKNELSFQPANLNHCYTATLTATADEFTVDVAGFDEFAIVTNGISSDEVAVYASLHKNSTIFAQILDDDDTNPFTADAMRKILVSPYQLIKVVKTGASDTVTVEFTKSKLNAR